MKDGATTEVDVEIKNVAEAVEPRLMQQNTNLSVRKTGTNASSPKLNYFLKSFKT